MDRITAIFNDMEHAEAAVNDLRKEGIPDERIGLVKRHPEGEQQSSTATDAAKGAGWGAVAGGVIGLGAAFIPGVGPFISAGVLTSWLGTVAGSTAAGAVVGGAAGGLGEYFTRAGYSDEESRYYAERVERGGVLLGVDTSGEIQEDKVLTTIAQHQGETRVTAGAATS